MHAWKPSLQIVATENSKRGTEPVPRHPPSGRVGQSEAVLLSRTGVDASSRNAISRAAWRPAVPTGHGRHPWPGVAGQACP
ncbi:hypothetical protein G6F55_014396 [Rhizopus delemar]|nr:hypothetical protein G6F55_014396 [Rhizopus delemar]